MDGSLYLDTARIGQMAPSASIACNEVLKLAHKNPRLVAEILRCSDEFGNSGIVPFWFGINAIKRKLLPNSQLNRPPGSLLFADKSSTFAKLVSRCFSVFCRNVLITDLDWEPYVKILNTEMQQASGKVTKVYVRNKIFSKTSGDEIINELACKFLKHKCDGLLLTGVSSDGIKLPMEKIVRRIQAETKIRFIAVDGSQEFGNERFELTSEFDAYIFSGHKWLGSYVPSPVCWCGNIRTQEFIKSTLRRMTEQKEINDSLLKYLCALGSNKELPNETVNLLSPFAIAGALNDLNVSAHQNGY